MTDMIADRSTVNHYFLLNSTSFKLAWFPDGPRICCRTTSFFMVERDLHLPKTFSSNSGKTCHAFWDGVLEPLSCFMFINVEYIPV
jgi:hypothetical protein